MNNKPLSTQSPSDGTLPIELVDKLDELFPKGKCKERGQAMVFLAFAVMHYKSQKAQWDRESRIDERKKGKADVMMLRHSFTYDDGSTVRGHLRREIADDFDKRIAELTSLNKGEN